MRARTLPYPGGHRTLAVKARRWPDWIDRPVAIALAVLESRFVWKRHLARGRGALLTDGYGRHMAERPFESGRMRRIPPCARYGTSGARWSADARELSRIMGVFAPPASPET